MNGVTPPLLHSIPSSMAMLDIPRSRMYEEIKAGRLATVKIGRRTMIKHSELVRYVEALDSTQAA